jgi:corrinoid protein of di/trimethylamine methyltransferase
MQKERILNELVKAVVSLEAENVRKLTFESVKIGIPPKLVIERGILKGLEIVGEKYEKMEYFLTELIMAGIIAEEGLQIIEPYLKNEKAKSAGIIVIGTVKGDLHDIGKNILASLLKLADFEVYDLGTDVSAEKFVEKVRELDADILALSALLTATMPRMKEIIDLLKAVGLRDKVKVMVGGRPVTQKFANEIGADFYCKDAMDGLEKARGIVTNRN